MLICCNCRKEINSDTNFCPNCGTALENTNNEQKRNIIFEGTIYKCPNCGETLNSFTGNCSSCGYELRNIKKSSAISELTLKLEEIEKKRNPDIEIKLMRMREWYGTANVGFSPTDEQKISLIKNFPIPNTKEDLYEFLILSKSNIDFSNNGFNLANDARYAISKAWKSKFEQAYLKTKILFKDDDRMLEINEMYEDINKSINHANLRFWILLGIIFGILVLMMIIPRILLVK